MLPDLALCGGGGTCYHATNLLFHILNGLMLFWLLAEKLKLRPWIAFALTAVFVSHLCLSEAVYWMGARNFSVQLFFSLLTVFCLLSWRAGAKWSAYFAMLTFYFLALGAKSSSIALTPLIFLLWPYQRTGWWRAVAGLLPVAMGLGGVLWIILHYSNVSSPHQSDFLTMPLMERLGVASEAFVFYMQRALGAWESHVFYDVQRFDIHGWQWLVALLWLPITILAFQKNHMWAVCAWVWIAATLIPILKIVPFGENSAVNDRYLYASLPGFLVVLGLAWEHLFARSPKAGRGFAVVVFGFITLQSYLSFKQGEHWRSDEALWNHVLECDAYNAMAHTSLGRIALSLGDQAKAEQHLEKALASRPNGAGTLLNLALVKRNKGDTAIAVELAERAILAYPTMPEGYEVRGHLFLDQNDLPSAAKSYENCVRAAGVRPSCSFAAAKVYLLLGSCEKAVPHLLMTIRYGQNVIEARDYLKRCGI